jgi:hypothetical protein
LLIRIVNKLSAEEEDTVSTCSGLSFVRAASPDKKEDGDEEEWTVVGSTPEVAETEVVPEVAAEVKEATPVAEEVQVSNFKAGSCGWLKVYLHNPTDCVVRHNFHR